MNTFDSLKEKSIKEIVQFLIESGFSVPKDDWFHVVANFNEVTRYSTHEKKYILIYGKHNQLFYNESNEFNSVKSNNENWYTECTREKVKQRISAL